ncbi:MAG TPA: class I SAM-dependent methyltransferase [Blastocatellia bacterium]|nr:class I SAM-dependent methyltransferase [Blastocatellia bacterium]
MTGSDTQQADRISMQEIFTRIYRCNHWGDPESVSGPGSGLERTSVFRNKLAGLFREIGARSLLDAPCGDFNWMSETPLELDRYVGVDVVAELITRNRQRYGSATRTFMHLDMTTDPLPRADVILSRDGLVHLSLSDCLAALRNFKRSQSGWLLATTFIHFPANGDIATGGWRQLNLQKPPFNFPPPHRLIDEKCLHSGGIYADKRLGLWELRTLPL